VLLMMVGVLIFGTTQFIPQLLQQVLGYTATDAGLALTAGGAATILVMPISGILGSKVDPRFLIGFSLAIQAAALWNMSHLNTDISFGVAARARVFQALGLPFMFVPITAVAYVGLKPEESNQASAIMNVMRNLGGSIGISMVQTLTAQRVQFHQARYAETLNPLNPNYAQATDQIAQTLQSFGQSAADAPGQALGKIYGSLSQQASMLAYIDAFHTLMIMTLCCLPLLLLMQPPRKGAKPPAGAGH
jgi:MFS transporter, DHA2 family, multidrug resistance protein